MPAPNDDRPPPLAEAVLGWLLRDAWQTPLGDFEEYYHEVARRHGAGRARWWYRAQVARLLPDRLYEKTLWNAIMLKNYVVLAYRTLRKNHVASAINIFGLSIAIGCSIVAYLFVHSHLAAERFHEHAARIFLVESISVEEEGLQTWGTTAVPLGPAMEADLPGVIRAVRLADARAGVQVGDNEFNEWIRFVDDGFFDMFTFPLKYGNPDALDRRGSVILSEQTAIKYFGDENPIGRALTLSLGGQDLGTFTVQGVAEPFPAHADLQFRLLVNYAEKSKLDGPHAEDWSRLTAATFIQVEDPEDVAAIADQMDRYVALQNAASEERPVTAFAFDNLLMLTRNSDDVRNTVAGSIPWAPIIVLSSIAVFLLLLSCFNYMNIALATAARRFKEIGIRKVVGSNKMQLVAQFLAENTLLCLLSLVLGMGIAGGLFVPAFNDIASLNLALNVTENLDVWYFLIGLLLVVGLVSGIYPAFYISAFQPVAILRGDHRLRRKNPFTQLFLTFQFVLAFITMIGSVVFTLNSIDQERRDWGYDREHTLVVRLTESSQYDVLHSEALRLPTVLAVSGSQDHVGKTWRAPTVMHHAEPMEAVVFDVGPAYLETLGLRLQTGQFFDQAFGGEAARTVVVNEAFARALGGTTPVGQSVRLDSTLYTVIGVTEDFHYNDFSDAIEPALFRLTDASAYRYLVLRLEAGTGTEAASALEDSWQRLLPDVPFTFFFQDTVFDSFYQETRGINQIFIFTAVMALLISCMGLFGLASQHTASRMKEISIRKVLGASMIHVMRLVNSRFLLLLAVAALLATPISYLLLPPLLDSIYTYHIGVGPLALFMAYILVFITATLTVVTQGHRLATTNPAEVLRTE